MKLAEWMAAEGLDDEAVALRVGSDRSTISRIRRGLTRPRWPLLVRIRDASGGSVTADDFLPPATAEPAEARA